MNEETRQYLEEVIRTFESVFKRRGSAWYTKYDYNAHDWEMRLYRRAKEVLKANLRQTS